MSPVGFRTTIGDVDGCLGASTSATRRKRLDSPLLALVGQHPAMQDTIQCDHRLDRIGFAGDVERRPK